MSGVVQGVGFRPFVHRCASDLGLRGFVGNDSTSVFIEVEGEPALIDRFTDGLRTSAPPMALVESVSSTDLPPTGDATFRIVESTAADGPRTLVPPDIAVCEDCMAEVRDPADRRHRHPFANCTNCGPRFTIIRDLPYDRPATTMAGFTPCPDCAAEYADPADRRHHAQPIACPRCGPVVALESGGQRVTGTDAVIAEWQRRIRIGEVVAVKGVGGYHLTCDATSDDAVRLLRERKARGDKPFAVMVADLAAARRHAHVDDAEASALQSPQRPIVLLRRRDDSALSALVAPGNPWIGVLLPYTPLHHLLLAPVPGVDHTPPAAIVMTSGNVADEPICTDDADASTRLAGLADAFLVHDRPIHVPCDDSVVRVVDGAILPIRRSRGYAPLPVALPVEVMPTLAVGGELKNTCCIAEGRHAWLSQHVGDMGNLETLHAFEHGVDALRTMYAIEPLVIAADGHPAYLTRRWALRRGDGTRVVEVQHHHAHVAALMAESGLDGRTPVLGFAFDGSGYGVGADGMPQIWGGEVLEADYDRFDRVGHLLPLPLPGGDEAVRNPCRVAVAYLHALDIRADGLPCAQACDPVELGVVRRQVERGIGCVPTTSMGRLFDAVASILGVRHRATYEAQAAIELEALAAAVGDPPVRWSFEVDARGVIDPRPVLAGVADDVQAGLDAPTIAAAFHRAVADVVVRFATDRVHRAGGALPVALTGGVFQNAVLTSLTRHMLHERGLEVLTHHVVPPNDGGIALGQAVVAGRGRA